MCVLAALALSAWGCAGEIAGREPFSREDIAAQSTDARESARTRGELREALGAPWLSSARRRVDVFRTTGTQRNGMLIFAPYPIPLPSFSKKVQGITLVSYDAAGSVDSAESGFSTSTLGQANSSFGLTAGDYLFVEGMFGRTLSVSPARFLTERIAAADCLLLVACGTNRPARVEFESFEAMGAAAGGTGGACWNELAIDGGARQRLSLSNIWYYRALDTWPSSQARERGSETCRKDVASCTVAHDYLVPVQVAPGPHQVRFSAKSVDGEVTAELSCRAGEAVFAKLVGETHEAYSFGKQLLRGFRLAAATGRIEFSGDLPADLARHTVLLAEAGKWLLPEDAAITSAGATAPSGTGDSPPESR